MWFLQQIKELQNENGLFKSRHSDHDKLADYTKGPCCTRTILKREIQRLANYDEKILI